MSKDLTMNLWKLFSLAAGVVALGAPDSLAVLNVVATMSTFADLAQTVGGEHVSVTSVAHPTFNPHFIEPRPSDVLKVKRADLFLHAGLDLEVWRGPLVDAAANPRVRPGGDRQLDLSQGIPLLEIPRSPLSRAEGDIHLFGNPHYWISPDNAEIIARSIAAKLAELDGDHAEVFQRNLDIFLARLDEKKQEWQARLQPFHGRDLVGYHNEWPYFMEFTGLKMDMFLEPKPGIPPGPQHVATVEAFIREHNVPAIVSTSYQPRTSAEQVARKSGIRLLLLCQNVNEISQAADYIALMEYNVEKLAGALGP
jgi:ABC-type Zn uptake system ZnuABC Zn-binding protein ZnuA